jgi:2-(1,2-epoxy-1,2-dihydrophenyl)acetyl-CoA isomerase
MSYTKILFTIADGVATISLNRPDKLNSFDREMALETIDALDKLQGRCQRAGRAAHRRGRAFCAGQDLAEAIAPGTKIEEIISTQYNPIVRRIRNLPKPVVCAVNGVAAGAGANIAYACDLTLAAESANFIQSFINIGLIPDSGGTFTLPRLVGMQRAFGQMILAPKVSAKEAEAQGMIWKAVPDAELMNEATRWRRSWPPCPPRPSPSPRKPSTASQNTSLDSQLDHENELQSIAGRSHDYNEGVKAFLEKRKSRGE